MVLKRDGTGVVQSSSCAATAGRWVSPYDGATWTAASDVDIDHMVPLSNAWKSGAAAWTTSKRQSFANDLSNPQLWTVTDNVNESKGMIRVYFHDIVKLSLRSHVRRSRPRDLETSTSELLVHVRAVLGQGQVRVRSLGHERGEERVVEHVKYMLSGGTREGIREKLGPYAKQRDVGEQRE